MRKKIKKTFSEKAIAKRIAKLGATIRKDAGDSHVLLLGILKGASFFLADLSRAIPGEVSYGFIDVVRETADTEVAAATQINFLSWINISGKNVYLLKDVVSSGVIENYLLTQLRQKKPANLKLVALLDRADLRTVDISPDYSAFKVDHGGSYVGYGLELEGKHGNLPWIGRM